MIYRYVSGQENRDYENGLCEFTDGTHLCDDCLPMDDPDGEIIDILFDKWETCDECGCYGDGTSDDDE